MRERKADIPLLVAAFVEKHADPARPIETISDDFWHFVTSLSWPGNVRELENFVVRSVALGSGPVLRNEDECAMPGNTTADPSGGEMASLAQLERRAIMKALDTAKGDKIAAARTLGIGKTTLYRKLKEYQQKPE
ncbi:MAG TPA: helix-turn-helix domain-containing protein [Candidatus Acidoferrum sp.]|nr:helix-turn-helix domain-containing protein [Candidatus Acidoferrum sp.]